MGGKELEKSTLAADEELLEEGRDHEAIVLTVFMHCEGCARKVRRCLKGFQGVESVETDCSRHRVVVRGEKADPLKVLGRLRTKTHKRVELISPIPNQQQQQQQQQHHPHIITTLLLKVHMHCHACAQHIKTTIHRIKGVESVEADLKTSLVRVKGAIHPAHLLQYLHRTTRKHAAILNQHPQQLIKPPPPDHNNNSQILLLEPAKHDDHDQDKLILQDNKQLDAASEKKAVDIHDEQVTQVEQKAASASADVKVEEEVEEEEEEEEEVAVKVVEAVNNNEYNHNNNNNVVCYPQRYIMAAEMYPYPPPPPPPPLHMVVDAYPPSPPPLPMIGHAYPPQMFSDENPNACSLM